MHERFTHHLFLRLFGDKIYIAPIESPKRILDLGTGTGLWAIDMADRHEDALVKGVDLNPMPKVPHPNLEFEIDDIRQEWPPQAPFDFIHIRILFASINDWPALYKQCFKYVCCL